MLYWAAQLIIYSVSFGPEILQGSFSQYGDLPHEKLRQSSEANPENGFDIHMKNAEFYADQICCGVATSYNRTCTYWVATIYFSR
ncbi:hypothetical protein N7532_010802 [Penicillium argentinense]|uniref:Uncharacterized protein n=1 Tax=Penicillium argentinense TaxID=1131581 RepID=A0A9W9EQD8_9EURO|nr:uncharacterized protein N7532_010802 [Penicillium argentinense]KAJ5086031.1 hypothetical protein N7532_010802 [Penicillium argentinense]